MTKLLKNKTVIIFVLLAISSLGFLAHLHLSNDLPEGVFITEEICVGSEFEKGPACIPSKYAILRDDYTEDLSMEMCKEVGGYYERVYVGRITGHSFECLVDEPSQLN